MRRELLPWHLGEEFFICLIKTSVCRRGKGRVRTSSLSSWLRGWSLLPGYTHQGSEMCGASRFPSSKLFVKKCKASVSLDAELHCCWTLVQLDVLLLLSSSELHLLLLFTRTCKYQNLCTRNCKYVGRHCASLSFLGFKAEIVVNKITIYLLITNS